MLFTFFAFHSPFCSMSPALAQLAELGSARYAAKLATRAKLVRSHVDHWFGPENLLRDPALLRSLAAHAGWVPAADLCGLARLRVLRATPATVAEAVRASDVVECALRARRAGRAAAAPRREWHVRRRGLGLERLATLADAARARLAGASDGSALAYSGPRAVPRPAATPLEIAAAVARARALARADDAAGAVAGGVALGFAMEWSDGEGGRRPALVQLASADEARDARPPLPRRF